MLDASNVFNMLRISRTTWKKGWRAPAAIWRSRKQLGQLSHDGGVHRPRL
jgi:hypothetical protein